MMRRWLTSIVLTAVIVVAVGVALVGCGSQKRTIPTKTAQSYLRQLDNIQSQYDNGSCSGARAKVVALQAQVRRLPSSVDSEVKQNLDDGVARLRTLVAACQPATPTNTTPTATVPTVPTVTQTVPTVTNTVPTTPNTTPNTVPSTPNTTPNTTPTTPGGGGGVSVPGTGVGGGTP
jgi:hypothetical protein